MTTPNGELSPEGTFEHTLQITTGLGPNLQAILDRGGTPGAGWFIPAGGSFAPGSKQVDGVAGASGFSYHAWDLWYVSVNKNTTEISNWEKGVHEIDGLAADLAAADLGLIDVNYLLNTKALLDNYIRWLVSAHESLVQWAGRIGAGYSQFHGLAAHVITNRVIQIGKIVDGLNRQLTTDKSPPPSQALQQNADALYRFGREMTELWNEYTGLMHNAVDTAMSAVVTNLYKYIVGMGLDRAASNPYVLDRLAEDSRENAEAYIRSVIAGYHSDTNTAPEFNREVRAISGSYQSEVVVSESGETRTFDRGELPDGMESFGGPLDSPATWDVINARISDYVRKIMAPLNERAVELRSNLADSYRSSASSLVEITKPNPALDGDDSANGGNGSEAKNGGNRGNGNTNELPPPVRGKDDLTLGQQGDGEINGPGGGDDRSNGQGNQPIVDPPLDGAGNGQQNGPPPLGDGNGLASNGNGEVSFATPGGENQADGAPGGDNGVNGLFNGSDFPGPGVAAADGSGDSNFAAGDPNGDQNEWGHRAFMPPFMPAGGAVGMNGGPGSRDGLVPSSRNNRLLAPGGDADEAAEFADQPSIVPEIENDSADSNGLDFENLGPNSTEGIAAAAVPDAGASLADQLAGGSDRPEGSVYVPGLTDEGGWNGGDFGALSEQELGLAGGAVSNADINEVVLPAGGALGAPDLSESVFPGGGLDGEALGLGPESTPIHAFDGQGWSEDLPEQEAGVGSAGVGARHPRMPMMPMMPPGANQGKNQERQRLTWLSEDSEVWGTRSDVGIGILGLPAETTKELEEQRVSTHVHAPVSVPRDASIGGVSGDEKDVGQGAFENERKDES